MSKDEYPYVDRGVVSTNGQITVNKETRKKLDIQQGDVVWFRILKVDNEYGNTKWEDKEEKERDVYKTGE